MKLTCFRGALRLSLLLGLGLAAAVQAATIDPALQPAPADGFGAGTVGGSAAIGSQIYTVATRPQLLAALQRGGVNPKIIKLNGSIDMTEGVPFANSGDQAIRGLIRLPSNTTLIGANGTAAIVNGHIVVSNVTQVIIRNLKIENPCDVGPIWDPSDGALGNWNAAFDGIGVSGSDHVWVDHVSFTDGARTDDQLPVENGQVRQCHDGALDITNASDYVTVSYNVFGQHRKNNLIGSSDTATADNGKLHITFSNNVFRDIVSRAPRVRYGQVHLFNNYFVGSKSHPAYPYEYTVGVGQQAQILSHNNVFEIAGVTRCDEVVTPIGGTVPGAFKDSGSVLNGAALSGCSTPGSVAYSVPYAYSARPMALVKANAIAQAGAGKLTSTISGSGNVTPDTTITLTCPASGLYFCDDFQNSSMANWNLLPVSGPNGSFSVKAESIGASNIVMQYTAASTGGVLATLKPTAMASVPSGDYYVEARIKPMTNSTTGNKLLYLLTRYKDVANWYGAGLNVQSATTSTQVEIARMLAGTLTRPKQVKKPIQMDAQFYTVRFEMIGSTLTVYLDGEALGTVSDASFAERGVIGLYTANKSFQIDDVRIGDPSLKPSQLTLNPATLSYSAEVGDAPLAVSVNAVKPDGTLDTFSAVSSNPAVAAVSVNGTLLSVTPVGAGNATITVSSDSDPTLLRTIAATISPQFVQPTQTYALAGAALPASHADAIHVDASLKLTFDGPPTLGTGGSIRIFRKTDNALVDVIRLSGETDLLGYAGQANVRKVNTTPVSISGNTATIKPHANKLAYGTEYYVAISNGVFTGATLGGVPFSGIGVLGDWSFTTRAAAPAAGANLTVGDAADTDFSTVQGALNFAMQTLGASEPVAITVRNGIYNELLYLRGKDNVTIKGESRDGVIIQYTNHDTLNTGSGASQANIDAAPAGGRSVLLVESSDLLVLDTITLKNTTLRSSAISAQAETLYFNNDNGRLIARNANFYSEQDTLNLKGWSWFTNTLVAGNVDFIWGSSRAALFEDSEIRSVGDTSNASNGGYILQARVANAGDKGYVFLNSRLTHGPGPGPLHGDVPAGATYLARSAGNAAYWDNIAFINTSMDVHIATTGWAGAGVNGQPAPNPAVASAASGWREYGSTTPTGEAINLAARVGGFQLSASDVAAGYADRAKVFAAYGGGIGWNPQP
ncbi:MULTISPECIES: pectinesterase family protein [unclassified Duganella]|uniref:pectinesterase family protein n=1 Tax=unclassified Duganella TaxID=2636909 RepID=UPI00088398FF|nr:MULTISPECIES: pectinesterase family protein [unclassified Duganella]SDG44672.1 Pectate lyase [Duganella sp. OV458]SDJ59261.1 Pectate lyase [Duganella sp. OV510]